MILLKENIISIVSIIIAVLSMILSVFSIYFTVKKRVNDFRSIIKYSNSFSIPSKNKNNPIEELHLELKNYGSKAIIIGVKDCVGNFVKLPNKEIVVDENGIFDLIVFFNTSKAYKVKLLIKDLDNRFYIQTITGKDIYPQIIDAKRICRLFYNKYEFKTK